MATIEHVQANSVASSSHQNGLIDQVNANTGDIATTNTTVADHETRITDIESAATTGTFFGQWSDDNANAGGITIDNGDGEKLTDINTAVVSPSGCSLTNGTFTTSEAGLWLFTVSIQTIGGSANSGTRALFLSRGSGATWSSGNRFGLNAAGDAATALTTTAVIRVAAGESITAYAAMWTSGESTGLWRSGGNILSATFLSR